MSDPTDTEPSRWTCYRRNYFQVACSYSLSLPVHIGDLRWVDENNEAHPVHTIAVNISASIEDEGSTPIALVQHTPKRDKGPQSEPKRMVLAPRTAPPTHGAQQHDQQGLPLYSARIAFAEGHATTDYTYE